MNDQLPLVLRLFARFVPRDLREPIAGDLHEEYLAIRRHRGLARATAWLWWQSLRLAITFTWEQSAHGRPLPPIGDELRGLGSVWDGLRQDIGFGVRMLRRQPGFTVVALIALALGIGANTAIFSIVDAVLWRPLSYSGSDRIVSIAEQRPREAYRHGAVAPADFYDWRRDSRSFSAMAAVEDTVVNLSGGGEPERLRANLSTPGFLDVLGVVPARGRDFRADEEMPGRHRVVLLTDGLWRRRFGANASIVGQTLSINGNPHEIVGVLPSTFSWSIQPDVVLPYALPANGNPSRNLHSVSVVARLKSGLTLDQARADLDAIGRRLSDQYPADNTGHAPHALMLQESLVGDARPALLVLLGAVALVQLIACANVATLLLAKAAGRQQELAVRIALGAGRPRLLRQLLTESVLLSLLGGAVGLVIAAWSVNAFRTLLPEQFGAIPGVDRIAIDGRVLVVALIASSVTGLVFGVMPALAASDLQTGPVLHEQGRGGGAGARSSRMRAALVVVEMALSLVLLIGAGLSLVSFKKLVDVPPGFNSKNIVAAPIFLPAGRYDTHARVVAFYTALLERLRAMPGVEAAAVVTALPFTGADARLGFQIEGRTTPSPIPVRTHPRIVSTEYLSTLGVPLVRGRAFTDRDGEGADVLIINAAAAHRFWPQDDPIGRRVRFGDDQPWLEIVGLVGDIKQHRLDIDTEPEAYIPLNQAGFLRSNLWTMARGMTVIVRARSDAATMAPMIKAAVAELDRNQPLGLVSQMDTLIASSVAAQRLNLWLVSAFAIVAVVLTAAGLYGVMGYLVAQRTHEIGVRMALGASHGRVLSLVVRQVGAMTLAGIVIGLGGALVLARYLASLLFGVSATDPLVYVSVSVGLAVIALVAMAVPSWRATRVDPLTALRNP